MHCVQYNNTYNTTYHQFNLSSIFMFYLHVVNHIRYSPAKLSTVTDLPISFAFTVSPLIMLFGIMLIKLSARLLLIRNWYMLRSFSINSSVKIVTYIHSPDAIVL